uniref:Transmembrane protein 198 n=1 Tax=Cynoglossus semilaevis TaxID=244447 RepID=A0A3P8X3B8_CYNSE
ISDVVTADLTVVETCRLQVNSQYDVISAVISSLCFSFGLIYCFLGYRCFRMVMFLSGFMFGTVAILLLYHKEPLLVVHLGVEAKAGIGLGVGVLCGLMTVTLSTLGLFLSGLQLGSLLCLLPLVVVRQYHSLTPVWLLLSSILTVSIITAVVSLRWQKLFSIVYTSVVGSTTLMLCTDHLVGAFKLPTQVYQMFGQVVPGPLCWFNWVIIGICPGLSLLGVLVQWKITAKGMAAKTPPHRNSRRRKAKRKPPLLKRYAGDVLAPSYLQSLQERQTRTGSSTCSVSTVTHTLIDFDYETGSMVPLTRTPSGPAPTFTL